MGMLYPQQQRLYNDPISEEFLSGGNKYFVKLMHIPLVLKLVTWFYETLYPGVLGYFFGRFRYYDEVIKECLAKNEVDAIVNLGAGMDPRAYYIPGIDKVRYFEVDHPDVVKRKKETVERALGGLPEHVTFVAVDFNVQDVEEELFKSGYHTTSKTLFIWESVSAYLTSDANDAVFSFVGKAPRGSKLAFSYATKAFLTGERLDNKVLQKVSRIMTKKYRMVIHGFDPDTIGNHVAKFRLAMRDHVGPEEFKQRYRIKEKMGLDVIEVERLVLAEVE
jgi:methyltransferase (TIGR00027 family)